MPTSLWLQVVQALAGRLTATAGYRYPTSEDAGVTVYVLQEIEQHEDPTGGDWVVVGWTGTPDARQSPGMVEQRSSVLAAGRPRDETGSVAVRVCAQTGDADPQPAVTKAMARLADVEGLLRDDPTLGVPARRMVAQLAAAEFLPVDVAGSMCQIDAVLTYTARI